MNLVCCIGSIPVCAAADPNNLIAHLEAFRHWALTRFGASGCYQVWRYLLFSIVAIGFFLRGLRCYTLTRANGTGSGSDDVPHVNQHVDVSSLPPPGALRREETLAGQHLFMIMNTHGDPVTWTPVGLTRVRRVPQGDLGVVRFSTFGQTVFVDVWLETPRLAIGDLQAYASLWLIAFNRNVRTSLPTTGDPIVVARVNDLVQMGTRRNLRTTDESAFRPLSVASTVEHLRCLTLVQFVGVVYHNVITLLVWMWFLTVIPSKPWSFQTTTIMDSCAYVALQMAVVWFCPKGGKSLDIFIVLAAPLLEELTMMMVPSTSWWTMRFIYGLVESAAGGGVGHALHHAWLSQQSLVVRLVVHAAHNLFCVVSRQPALSGAGLARTNAGGPRNSHQANPTVGNAARGGAGNGKGGKSKNPKKGLVPYTQDEQPAPAPKPDMCVIMPKEAFAWFHGLYTTFDPVSEFWVTQGDCPGSGERTKHIVAHGDYLANYIADPAGTMKFSEKCEGRVARFPFEYVPPSPMFGFSGGWIFTPGLHKLREVLGATVAEEHNRRTALNVLMTSFQTLPVHIVSATVAYHACRSVAVNTGLGIGARLSTLPPPGELDRVVAAVRDLGVTNVVKVNLRPIAYENCDMRPSVDASERRELFKITRAKGAALTNGQLTYTTPDDRPMATFLRAFRLGGKREFVRYRRTANNQAASFVRLYKLRGATLCEDYQMTANQLSLVDQVIPYRRVPELMKLGNMSVKRESFEIRREKWVTSYTKVRDDRQTLIANVYRQILDEYSMIPSYVWLYRFARKLWELMLSVGMYGVYLPQLVFLLLFDVITFRYFYGKFPADKKKLRMSVGLKFFGANTLTDPVMCDEIKMEVKDEPAKPGKPPRMYFSLGEAASMFGGAHIAIAKKAMCGMREVCIGAKTYRFKFVDNNRCVDLGLDLAQALFDRAFGIVTVFFFSDDMLYIGEDIVEYDISSCDSSHSYGIFAVVFWFLLRCFIPGHIALGLFEQITRPFRIRNPANPRNEWLMGYFQTFYLVSGTVLTTITNNFASLLISAAIVAHELHGAGDDVIDWIRKTGYVVTREERACMEQATLLKRFPCRTEDGSIAAPLCLGALLKTFGDIRPALDDTTVPGSKGMSLEDRARMFLGAVVASWVNEPSHPLLDVLRELFPAPGLAVKLPSDGLYKLSSQRDGRRLDVDSICSRYGVSRWEYDGLVESLRSLVGTDVIGLDITSPFMTRVLSCDYSL